MASSEPRSPGAVRIFAVDHPAAPGTLLAKLQQLKADQVSQLPTGCVTSWEDFKERVGVIRGLETAIQVCAETEDELNR